MLGAVVVVIHFGEYIGDDGPFSVVMMVCSSFHVTWCVTNMVCSSFHVAPTAASGNARLGNADDRGPAKDVRPEAMLLIVFGKADEIDALNVHHVALYVSIFSMRLQPKIAMQMFSDASQHATRAPRGTRARMTEKSIKITSFACRILIPFRISPSISTPCPAVPSKFFGAC
jgi:hypothetical protein